ncbi:MAG: RNA polymerase sigma factor [bacterium]
MNSEEREWIKRIQARDRESFKQLYDQYHQELFNFLWYLTNSKEEAENLTQNVFLNIWTKGEKWNPHTALRSFLYRCCKNEYLNFIRKGKTNPLFAAVEITAANSSTNFGPEVDNEKEELKRSITKIIKSMPERKRLAFILRYYFDMPYHQIAEILDISIATVNRDMASAYRILREKLKAFLFILNKR